MPKLKTPFDPNHPEYNNKPAFLAQMQWFIKLCQEKHGATRCGHEICSIQYGVSIEYQILLPPPTSGAVNGNRITAETIHGGRSLHFHLVVNYKERIDGVSAAHLQYDSKKYPQLAPLRDEIKSLLEEIKNGRPHSTSGGRLCAWGGMMLPRLPNIGCSSSINWIPDPKWSREGVFPWRNGHLWISWEDNGSK